MPCCDTGRNIQKYKGGGASTLQDALENGNTASLNINLSSPAIFIGDGGGLSNINASATTGNLQAVTDNGATTTNKIILTNSATSLETSGNIVVSTNVYAMEFYGDGGTLSNIAANKNFQEVTDIGATTSNKITLTNSVTSLETSGNVLVTGNVTASKFYGDGTTLDGIALSTDLADNSTRISTLSTDLASNSSRISTLSTDLASNSSRISTVSTDLADNSTRISTLSTDLADNSTRISTVSTDLADNSTRISTVSTDLADNSTRISTVSGDLVSNASRISVLEGEIQPVIRGGTNITTYSKGDILIASATDTLSNLGLGQSGYVLTSNSTSGLPEWISSSDLGTEVSNLYNGSYILGGTYNGIQEKTWSVQASTSNTSNYIVARDSSGDIFVSNVNAIKYYGDGGTLSNISGSQNLQEVIEQNPYTNSPPYFGAGSYGAIYGSNTINASTISTTLGFYGPIKGSNTITTSGVYGPIYGSNTINASTISTTTGFYGPIKGSNTITTSGVYGPIYGSNTINASTISTTTGFYGPIKGSNTVTASSIVSDNAVGLNQLNASNINSGTLSNTYGGTGFTSYNQGDLLVGTGSGSNLKKLPKGSADHVLTVNSLGNDIEWAPASGVGNSLWTPSGSDIYYNSGNVGIANTAPIYTLDVGEVFSVVNSTSGGDVLILRGNAYFNNELYIAKKLTVPTGGEILADTIKCRSLSTKGTIVVAERIVNEILPG